MTVEVQPWLQELLNVHSRLALLFKRLEPKARVPGYLQGLLSNVERKNSWQLAEFIGDATPDEVQHLLERAHWDAQQARDTLRAYVIEHLGDADAVLMPGTARCAPQQLEWVSWFSHLGLLEPIGYIPPAEAEANYYQRPAQTSMVVA
jgi:SRSO17 transposase